MLNTRVLVYGSAGALGKKVSDIFNGNKWEVIGCDIATNAQSSNPIPSISVSGKTLEEQGGHVLRLMKEYSEKESKKFNAIICTSGGFAGGNLCASDFLNGADRMISSSIYPSLICSLIAKDYLLPNGLLLLPGAAAVQNVNPGILSYTASKAYVHHLVKSLGAEGSGMPQGSRVVGIAPVTLDTPANRAAMPNADFSNWTDMNTLSSKILEWACNPKLLESGRIYAVETIGGTTKYTEL